MACSVRCTDRRTARVLQQPYQPAVGLECWTNELNEVARRELPDATWPPAGFVGLLVLVVIAATTSGLTWKVLRDSRRDCHRGRLRGRWCYTDGGTFCRGDAAGDSVSPPRPASQSVHHGQFTVGETLGHESAAGSCAAAERCLSITTAAQHLLAGQWGGQLCPPHWSGGSVEAGAAIPGGVTPA